MLEIYSIEDCWRVLNPSSDLTMWDTSHKNMGNLQYDSTNSAYKIWNTSDGFGSVILNDPLSLGTGIQISVDIKILPSSNTQPRIGIWDSTYGIFIALHHTGYCYFRTGNGYTSDMSVVTSTKIVDNYTTAINHWKHIEFSIINDEIIGKSWEGDTLECHIIGDLPLHSYSSPKMGYQFCHSYNASMLLKNIKIKPL